MAFKIKVKYIWKAVTFLAARESKLQMRKSNGTQCFGLAFPSDLCHCPCAHPWLSCPLTHTYTHISFFTLDVPMDLLRQREEFTQVLHLQLSFFSFCKNWGGEDLQGLMRTIWGSNNVAASDYQLRTDLRAGSGMSSPTIKLYFLP